VQLVPFAFWVLAGDRGTGAAAWALSGALPPAAWWGLVVPGVPRAVGEGMVYVESLYVSAPILLCAALGLARRWRLWLLVGGLALLATLPKLGGSSLYLILTGGLVRYPSRFGLVAVACLLPFVGVGVSRWREGEGRSTAAVLAAATVLAAGLAGTWWAALLALVPAGLLLLAAAVPRAVRLRDAAVLAGLLSCAAAAVPQLGLTPTGRLRLSRTAWPEASSGGRLYTPAVDAGVRAWLSNGLGPRRRWPVGYLNLSQGLSLVRTYGPVFDRHLTRHLAQADFGPQGRWWLDTLAAHWVLLPRASPPPNMVPVSRHGGLWLFRNLQAQAVLSVAAEPPRAGRGWRGCGALIACRRRPHRISAVLTTPRPAFLWISLTPLRGWQWRVDGRPVEPEPGPGIVHSLEIAPGTHRVEGRYRVPGLGPAGGLSLAALLATLVLLVLGSSRGRGGTRRP
jgi:hypothetical protein